MSVAAKSMSVAVERNAARRRAATTSRNRRALAFAAARHRRAPRGYRHCRDRYRACAAALRRRCWHSARSTMSGSASALRRPASGLSPRSSRSSSGLRSSSLVDEGLQFEVRHLQQLDRLLQLRRHDQGLALAQFEPLVQRHGAASSRSQAEVGAEIIAPHIGIADDLMRACPRSGPGPHG